MNEPVTLCWLDTCRDVAHVILYASSDRLAGLQTRPRQPVAFCLKHGGEIYDVIRAWKAVAKRWGVDSADDIRHKHSAACPNWLVADLRNDRLPRISPDPKGWPRASAMATTRYQPGRRNA